MKKIFLVFLLFLVLITSCKNSGTVNEPPEGSDLSDVFDDIYEVVMQYPLMGSIPSGLQEVEDAINLRTEKEIGVRVKFYPVNRFDLGKTVGLLVSSGEKLDLMISLFEGGVSNYANTGILLELDSLVQHYGSDIVFAEGRAMSGGYINNKLYAVPSEEKMGRVSAFFARQDIVEKYSIDYDPNHIYTVEELDEVFAIVKAGEGKDFYCIAVNSQENLPFFYTDHMDFLGSSLASGCLLNYGVDSTEIVNYYETENFAKVCKYATEWYQKGYFSPDCNTTADPSLILMSSGNYFGRFLSAEPDMVASQSFGARRTIGTDLVPFYVSASSSMTQHFQISMWAIPITCENPVKTMQWLNMMYADEEIINLLCYGIEGVHWSFVEGSDKVIEFHVKNNLSYYSPYNVWGDKSKNYITAPFDETYYSELKSFNESIEKISCAIGYSFNSEPVRKAYTAVQDVINKYQASLALGVVNPDNIIPVYLDALKEAGIDNVIVENQKQFDEWLGIPVGGRSRLRQSEYRKQRDGFCFSEEAEEPSPTLLFTIFF